MESSTSGGNRKARKEKREDVGKKRKRAALKKKDVGSSRSLPSPQDNVGIDYSPGSTLNKRELKKKEQEASRKMDEANRRATRRSLPGVLEEEKKRLEDAAFRPALFKADNEAAPNDDHEYKDEGARMQTRKRMDNRSHEDRKEKRRKEDAKH